MDADQARPMRATKQALIAIFPSSDVMKLGDRQLCCGTSGHHSQITGFFFPFCILSYACVDIVGKTVDIGEVNGQRWYIIKCAGAITIGGNTL
jgi:hypothetical protein